MAPKSKVRVADDDEPNSDGGFVVEDEDARQPKRKRQRLEQSPAGTKEKGKGKDQRKITSVSGAGQKDDEGGIYWELSKNRRVTVSEFKGKRMIHLREYYLKDDKALPGKKGISLPLEQFSALIQVLPHIEKTLKEMGEEVPRPAYDEGGEADRETEPKPKKEAESDKKKNFEATSEEEEEDG